jgi:hypothetical protein
LPAGAKPVSRSIQYDDLYRVTIRAARTTSPPTSRCRHRVVSQSYEYDWLGSLTKSSDDLNAFWDRGMGPMRNDGGATPYRWQDAGDAANPAWSGTGWADTGGPQLATTKPAT